jgi:hypothetical protein
MIQSLVGSGFTPGVTFSDFLEPVLAKRTSDDLLIVIPSVERGTWAGGETQMGLTQLA